MRETVWNKFVDYTDKIKDLSWEQYDYLCDLFNDKLKDEDMKKFEILIDGYEEMEVYNYRLLKESLEDIINNNVITEEDTEEKVEEPKKVSVLSSKLNEIKNEVEEEDFDEEELDEEEMDKATEIEEEPKSDLIEEDFDDYYDDEELEEEEKEEEEKKIGFFKKLYYNHIKKYKYVEGKLDPIEIKEAKEKRKFSLKSFFGKIKSKFKKDETKKLEAINTFINEYYPGNSEIETFMNLLEEREDKQRIINKLYRYINYSNGAYDGEKFINKLYKIFNIAKEEEKSLEEKEDKIEDFIEEVKEPKKISFLNDKLTKIKKEDNNAIDEDFDGYFEDEEIEEEKVEKVNKIKISDKYQERMNALRNEFTNYELMFIDDVHSEGLELSDSEFDQMLNERNIDKVRYYRYLLEVEKIKLLSICENYNHEMMFIEDAYSEGLNNDDQEYDQMANERNINKDVVLQLQDAIVSSKEKQDIIIEKCKNESLKLNNINLEDKKVKDLKEIAKDNNITKTSKMRKEELIKMLNELKQRKEAELDKKLGLIK